jgi:hypothetical protein
MSATPEVPVRPGTPRVWGYRIGYQVREPGPCRWLSGLGRKASGGRAAVGSVGGGWLVQ